MFVPQSGTVHEEGKGLSGETLVPAIASIAQARRSVYSYLDTPVPRPLLEHALSLAMLAPNHHRTRPWRFFVFENAGRERLAKAYERAAVRLERDVERARGRAFDAPAMVAIACFADGASARVRRNEEDFAVACATQTLMLALTAMGLATLLTTGDLAESEEVHALLGLDGPDRKVLGVLNVGWRNPERPLPPRPLQPLSATTIWFPDA